MSGDKERFLDAGMDNYPVKPFKPIDLYAAVERIRESRSHHKNEKHNNEAKLVNDSNSELPILDESAAMETTGGDSELTALLRTACLEEAPKLIAAAKAAVAESDWVTVRRQGHSLRSALGTIGAMAAQDRARELEATESDEVVDFNQAIEALENAFNQLLAHLA